MVQGSGPGLTRLRHELLSLFSGQLGNTVLQVELEGPLVGVPHPRVGREGS